MISLFFRALNDASVIMRGVLASSTTLADLLTLAPGVYQINYNFAWMPTGATYYGTLVSYVSGSGYGVIKYTDTTGKTWLRHHTTVSWHNNDWIAEVLDYHTWTANVNMNELKTTQIIWLSTNITNGPISGNLWAPCLVIGQAGSPSDTARQIVLRDVGISYRACQSGTWGAWKTVTIS